VILASHAVLVARGVDARWRMPGSAAIVVPSVDCDRMVSRSDADIFRRSHAEIFCLSHIEHVASIGGAY